MHVLNRILFAFVTTSTLLLAGPARAQNGGPEGVKEIADPLPEWAQIFAEFMQWDIFDIPIWRVSLCVLILVVGLFLKNYVISRLYKPFDRLLTRTATDLDNALLEAVRKPLTWIVFAFAVWLALGVLNLPDGIEQVSVLVLQTVGTVFVAWTIYRAIDVAGIAMQKFTQHTESEIDDHIVPLVKRVLRVVLVAFALVAIIQQWGYDVTSLIAGLGIGGLAFALAAKDTLANWFGSLMIFTDRPFTLGNWVKTGSIEGIVEEVGLRSTKIRTFDKSLITVPNKNIAHDSIENFSLREQRRINIKIGVEYRTSRAQMQEVLDGVKEVILGHELSDPETMTVFFSGFGDSALEVVIRVFLNTADYMEFMAAQQTIFLEIMRVVEEAGTAFAFPSQSVYMETPIETTTRMSA
jgi:MscS family membrane protein